MQITVEIVMKMLDGEKIRCLRNDVKNGLDIDETIYLLHQYEITITETMIFLVTEYQIGLGDAKRLVSKHPAWQEVVEASQPLIDELIDALRDEKS